MVFEHCAALGASVEAPFELGFSRFESAIDLARRDLEQLLFDGWGEGKVFFGPRQPKRRSAFSRTRPRVAGRVPDACRFNRAGEVYYDKKACVIWRQCSLWKGTVELCDRHAFGCRENSHYAGSRDDPRRGTKTLPEPLMNRNLDSSIERRVKTPRPYEWPALTIFPSAAVRILAMDGSARLR